MCIKRTRGSQYIAGDYTDELLELGVHFSVGSTGDSYDRLFDSVDRLEAETASWVAWWNAGRLR